MDKQRSIPRQIESQPDLDDSMLRRGYTPARRLIPVWIDRLSHASGKEAARLIHQIAGHEGLAAKAALEAFATSQRPQRAYLLELMIQVLTRAPSGCREDLPVKEVLETLVLAHGDKDLKTRTLALQCMPRVMAFLEQERGSQGGWKERWVQSVLAQWFEEPKPMRPELWRVFVRALAGLLDAQALTILTGDAWACRRQADPQDAQRLEDDRNLLQRSQILLRRDLLRCDLSAGLPKDASWRGDLAENFGRVGDLVRLSDSIRPPASWLAVFPCRQGLESFLREEISLVHPTSEQGRTLRPLEEGKRKSLGTGPWAGLSGYVLPLADFWNGRKDEHPKMVGNPLTKLLATVRTAECSGFFWPAGDGSSQKSSLLPQSPIDAVKQGLKDRLIREFLGFLAQGGGRFRLETGSFETREHLWEAVTELNRLLVPVGWSNDPRSAPWGWHWLQLHGQWGWFLSPKALLKQRFQYRLRDVPASTHGPLAAALARLAGPLDSSGPLSATLWDPFCGAGTELFEYSRLWTWTRALGCDVSQEAVASAEKNARVFANGCPQAGRIEWHCQDAQNADQLFKQLDFSPQLTITNPPYGKRVHRHTIKAFYETVVPLIFKMIPNNGTLVWVTPFREKTDFLLKSYGLDIEYSTPVDLGGFWGHIQKARKHSSRSTAFL